MKIRDFISRIEQQKDVDVILIYMEPSFYFHYSAYYYNLGLLYIASYLKERNYRVKCLGLLEIDNMTPEQIKNYFMTARAPLAGFYTMTDNIHYVKDFASLIKKWSPNTTIVVGGPHATSLREKILTEPSFDICALGEGEFTMAKIADWKIRKEGKLEEIPGIIYRKADKPELTSEPQPIKDLDSLPFPDYSMLSAVKYNRFMVAAGRGCPYKCMYCFQKVHGSYRKRNIESVVEEIIINLETNLYKGFFLVDDLFTTDLQRVEEFVKLLRLYRRKSGREFMFSCQGRFDVLDKNPEIIRLLKSVGLTRIQVGFEAGHDKILKILNRKMTVEQMKRVVKMVYDEGGVTITGNFLLGSPCESHETIDAMKKMIRELVDMAPGIVEPTVCHLVPYPETELTKNLDKFGLKDLTSKVLDRGTIYDVCITSDTLGVNDLRKAITEINQEISCSLKKNVKNISRDMLMKLVEWYADYDVTTLWSNFIINNRLLTDYYNRVMKKRYKIFSDIPSEKLLQWYPERVIDARCYSEDGNKLILPEGIDGVIILDNPDDILIYELASGKLTVKNMISEFKKDKNIDFSDEEILEKFFIPLFKRLDQSYHVVFHSYGG
jgi:anaerobic magnesium-protoporphyrin IX monomethyl ester cyclase